MLLKISIPKTSAQPSLGSMRPVSMEMVVVLPAPLCPKRAKIYPLYMVRFVPPTAVLFPNFLTRPLTLRQLFSLSCFLRESETISKFLLSLEPISSSARSLYLSASLILTPPLLLWKQKQRGLAIPN